MTGTRLKVVLPLPLPMGVLDYLLPPEMGDAIPPVGSLVKVPFGKKIMTGVIWLADSRAIPSGLRPVDEVRLKRVESIVAMPPLPESLCRLIDWIAAYVMVPVGSVLKLALPAVVLAETVSRGQPRAIHYRAPTVAPRVKLSAARQMVLQQLAGGESLTADDLAERAQVAKNLLRMMVKDQQLIQITETVTPSTAESLTVTASPAELSPEQQEIAEQLVTRVREQKFTKSLIHGVTGSGKTEVYFAAINQALAMGRQSLVLLPEIALSGQWLARFKNRFGFEPLVWHSNLSAKIRRETWQRILGTDQPLVVVGARSALFLPLSRLALMIVDEEHDSSFKQEEGVPYHGRDMAIVRAQLEQIPIILASATPSLETLFNVEQGRYQSYPLPLRHGTATLPTIKMIDLTRDMPERGSFLAPSLLKAMAETIQRGEQVALFLNRRGYAPLTLCRACGHRFGCKDCTSWLVEHRPINSSRPPRLECHQCGATRSVPKECPECHEVDSLVPCGPGIERLLEEVTKRFPSARIAAIASDMVSNSDLEAIFIQIQNRQIDIVIGTQIIAKGHHFPYLTLVGIVDADIGLHGGDLRASERSWQLLHQVSGRAGRAESSGQVYIQTRSPQHPVMVTLAQNRQAEFLKYELGERQYFNLPPYGRLAAVIVSAEDDGLARKVAQELGRMAPRGEGVEVFGPAAAPFAMLRGRYRYRLLLKTRRDILPQNLLRDWLVRVKRPAAVRVTVDIDPQNFV
ncbi:MAG: primosomal protein N' [Candidatus Pacebacteria bacterium]|nr:primosomal protein N' [Candidatus Paceibacterota bacterium]